MLNELFSLIKNLGDEYFINVAGREPFYRIENINTEQELYHIVNQDFTRLDCYFIIGIDIVPHDSRLRDNQIVGLILTEFEKLYPLYNFFKAPYSTHSTS